MKNDISIDDRLRKLEWQVEMLLAKIAISTDPTGYEARKKVDELLKTMPRELFEEDEL